MNRTCELLTCFLGLLLSMTGFCHAQSSKSFAGISIGDNIANTAVLHRESPCLNVAESLTINVISDGTKLGAFSDKNVSGFEGVVIRKNNHTLPYEGNCRLDSDIAVINLVFYKDKLCYAHYTVSKVAYKTKVRSRPEHSHNKDRTTITKYTKKLTGTDLIVQPGQITVVPHGKKWTGYEIDGTVWVIEAPTGPNIVIYDEKSMSEVLNDQQALK